MRLYQIVLFFLLLTVTKSFAQTVALPDTNLRNKLISSYPQVMQGNELNLSQASALTGTLDLANSNLHNAEGIQYFTSIISLRISDNQLSELPSLAGMSMLVNFYASNNKLTNLPDMTSLTQLTDFQAMNNQLTELPNISNNHNLRSLYCSGNQITTLPDLINFPNLVNFVVGDNPLISPLDFSKCPNLIELHIHKTNTDTIIGLDKLNKLEILYAWGNSIKDLSDLNQNTTLKQLVVFDNKVEEIPVLNNKPNLINVDINSCQLTFEDLEPIIQQNPSYTFTYKPQKKLLLQDYIFRAENNVNVPYPVSNASLNNNYEWYKNGELITGSTSEKLGFNPINLSDSGIYYLRVSNSTIPDLIIESDSFLITVKPCIEINTSFVEVLNKDCSTGYSIDLANTEINGGTEPFIYTLENETYTNTFTTTEIDNLPAGQYKISVTDTKKCTAENSFILDRISGCDPVLTPNGDGVADTFFIEEKGQILIYDYSRNLIRTLYGPTTWDGTNDRGETVEVGYYIIIPQETRSPTYITIIQ